MHWPDPRATFKRATLPKDNRHAQLPRGDVPALRAASAVGHADASVGAASHCFVQDAYETSDTLAGKAAWYAKVHAPFMNQAQTSATLGRPRGPRPPLTPATARELALGANASTVILVEGWSDQAAIDTLARRRGWDLRTEGILTLPIGGVTNLGAFIHVLGTSGLDLRLAGLCDAAEGDYARRVLERAGTATDHTRAGLEATGFFICDADLEDELIRALGTTATEAVIDAQGELNSFRRFQEQPAQRRCCLSAQLRRFMGTRAGRKVRYGSLLIDAIDLARMPRALELVIAHARA